MKEKRIIELIRKTLDHTGLITGSYKNNSQIKFGDFVLSGITTERKTHLGYMCQIRERIGAFGSDVFILRELNGKLSSHENQCFWKLSKEQILLSFPFFKITPKEEIEDNPNHKYSIANENIESGFIVKCDDPPERNDSFAMAITITQK